MLAMMNPDADPVVHHVPDARQGVGSHVAECGAMCHYPNEITGYRPWVTCAECAAAPAKVAGA